MSCNDRCNCAEDKAENSVSWYSKKCVNVKQDSDSNMCQWDVSLKDFVECCEKMSDIISELTDSRDRPAVNGEYYQFKKELIDMKNKAIVEAYSRKDLKWNF